jgi:hypothetical protein
LCAIVNPVDGITSPWGFLNKSGETTFAHGEFLEGAIDLNAVFGSNIPCFTTFMGETRASTSPTSTLSDFSPPVSFPLCGIAVTKSCSGNGVVSADGSSITYTFNGTVINSGVGNLYDVTVIDTLPDGTTQNIPVVRPYTTPNVLIGGATAAWSVQFVATRSNVPNPLDVVNRATAQGSTAEGSGTVISSPQPAATAECTTSVSSMVSIAKQCDASRGGATLVVVGGQVVVEVFYTGRVCNTSASGGGSQLTNITLADDHDTNQHDSPNPSTISSLNPGQCADVLGSYFPSGIDSLFGRFGFSDIIRVTGATATLGPNPSPVVGCPSATDLACASITCSICPQP